MLLENDLRSVQNCQALKDVFGDSLTFHDSEVVKVVVERESGDRPSLSIFLKIRPAQDGSGTAVNDKKDPIFTVELFFSEVELDSLVDFNEQNAVFEITISHGVNGKKAIKINPSYGCEMSFDCRDIRVQSVRRL